MVQIEVKKGVFARVYIVNLIDEEKRVKTFKRIHKLQKYHVKNQFLKIFLVVAGGDGSLISTADEAIKYKVDIDSLAFGLLPFGSGNDLAK